MADLNKIWEYYKEISDLDFFTDKGGNKRAKAYSLDFFYSNINYLTANTLLRAFFGDSAAHAELRNSREEYASCEDILRYSMKSRKPYSAQVTAIQRALAEPVSFVQGPPGTGKTEMILDLLLCIHGLHPERTVAVVAGNGEAVDNINDAVEETPELSKLREIYMPLGSKQKRKALMEKWLAEGRDTSMFDEDSYTLDPSILAEKPMFSSTVHSMTKCFSNGGRLPEYDYVIVDECSLLRIMVGLIAMGCAKHIVLVGDREQLAPVINDGIQAVSDKPVHESVPEIYKEREEKSFLDVCGSIFADAPDTLLDSHYRCHPSIAGFFNKYVYNGRLDIKTADDGQLRIRAVWYEGDYFENTAAQGEPAQIHNYRQLRIFMEEEWLLLRERLRQDDPPSICVISPYRHQLELLTEMLSESVNAELSDDEDYGIYILTIHKSQGKGYDIVYFMTVEDCSYRSSWPWSQSKRMVNVAVSRAKKEFCVIASSQWLPKLLQFKLTGYTLPVYMPSGGGLENNLFAVKLIEYTQMQSRTRETGDFFGLHKAKTCSIFDLIPLHRVNSGLKKGKPWATEQCFKDALAEIVSGKGLTVLCELPLSRIDTGCELDAELSGYAHNNARLDFAVCRGDRLLAAIEIDGSTHRKNDAEQERRDQLKDRFMALCKGTRYRRFVTDDSEPVDIKAAVASMIAEAEGSELTAAVRTDASAAEKLLKRIFDKVDECALFFDGLDTEEKRKTIASLDFSSDRTISDIPYSRKNTYAYYFYRYGLAYACEYITLHSVILTDTVRSGGSFNGVLSLGCGSMIDGYSLACAREYAAQIYPELREGYKKLRLSYTGYDIEDWGDSRLLSSADEGSGLFEKLRFFIGEDEGNILNAFGRGKSIESSVIIFPKILNELSENTANELIERIGQTHFPLNEYYICVSHSKIRTVKGAKLICRIIGEINKDCVFTVSDDIPSKYPELAGYDNFCSSASKEPDFIELFEQQLKYIEPEDPCSDLDNTEKCYMFESALTGDGSYLYSVNGYFDTFDKFDGYYPFRTVDEVKEHLTRHGIKDREPIRKVSQFVFQIIKLTREEE